MSALSELTTENLRTELKLAISRGDHEREHKIKRILAERKHAHDALPPMEEQRVRKWWTDD